MKLRKSVCSFISALTVIVILLSCTPVTAAEYETKAVKSADIIWQINVPEESKNFVGTTNQPLYKDADAVVVGNDKTVYVTDSPDLTFTKTGLIEKNISFKSSDYSHDELWITRWAASEICKNNDADWNYDMINVEAEIVDDEEKDPVYGDDKIKVAILDSGVDFVTSDANIIKNVNFVEEDQDLEPMLIDLTGHGSAVAGIISNINPEAEVYSVRVLDDHDTASLSRVAQGIYWCIENRVNIINMSFGTTVNSEILHEAIKAAKAQGILMIASAGNEPESGVEYPAKYPEVIAVGSVGDDWQKSVNSATGPEVELLAPGDKIFVQSMLGLYTIVNGTSFASAHAAGAASLIWQKNIERPSEFIRGLLKASSNKITADDESQAGIVDVQAAEELFDVYEYNPEDYINENDEEIGTYDDVEVKANWGIFNGQNGPINLHQLLAKDGIEISETSFTTQEAKALKSGAAYPDKADLSKTVPYHGRRKTNWIASYKYITAVAKEFRFCNGSLTYPDPSDVLGTNYSYYLSAVSQIQTDFTLNSVRYYKDNPSGENKTWLFVMTHYGADITNFDSLDLSVQLKLKSLFIYGVALHDLTDTFAHAAYTLEDGVYKLIVHDPSQVTDQPCIGGADDKDICPRRWTDAKYASADLVEMACIGHRGKIADFAPHVTTVYRGYFLHAPKDKACTLSNTLNNQTIFQYIDYLSYTP